jgi:tripartite-type tricarboxylate transporter receptor subunit TctC
MVASHIGKYLPGKPTVIPKNMPGAGSRQLAAYLYSQAAKDGTEFGLLLRPIATDSLFTDSGKRFDVQKFTWLGSPSAVTDTCGFWVTSPVQKWEDLQQTEVIIPGIGADAGEIAEANVIYNLTKARIRTVIGYQSGGEMTLAMERGEAHGRCAIAWEAIKSSYPDWLSEKKFKPFVQFAKQRHPELADVPTIMEMAKTELDKQALEVFLTPQEFGFPFAAPPGLHPDVAAILRKALQSVFEDPEFIAEAKSRKFDVQPVSGETLGAILTKIYSYPPEVIARAAEFKKRD